MIVTNPDWFSGIARAPSIQTDPIACGRMSLALKKLSTRLRMFLTAVAVLGNLHKRLRVLNDIFFI